MSPYASLANNPILSIDPRGDTTWYYSQKTGGLIERIDNSNPNQHFEMNDKFYKSARDIYKKNMSTLTVQSRRTST